MNKNIRKQVYQEAIDQSTQGEDKQSKPTWFAIKEYYNVIQKYLENISSCLITGSYRELFRSVKGLFYFVQPYIDPEKAKELKVLIKKAKNLYSYSENSSAIMVQLENILDEIVEKIFLASKNIFLPTTTDEDDDGTFNPEDVI